MQTVLFFRDFQLFRGGHLKVWDYFNHVLASPDHTARIAFTTESKWDSTNPWLGAREHVVDRACSVRPDLFFVAGKDWAELDRHPDAGADLPVINLVQHVRHANPRKQRFAYLERKAIRICVSDEVAEAVRGTGRANGPVIVVPLGLDLADLPAADGVPPEVDVLISAFKQPVLGAQLEQRVRRPERRVELLTDLLPRPEFLARVRRARTTVFLPNRTEGCHVPPLEGMALGTLVVCPDVPGVSYCLAGQNAFKPRYALVELVEAVEAALALPPERACQMRVNARQTAEGRDLHRERAAFLDVLNHVNQLW